MDKIIEEIAAERVRQQAVKGLTPEHDDHFNQNGELAEAAAAYCLSGFAPDFAGQIWPWGECFNPKNRRRDLVRAGALIVAEIERLDRSGYTACRVCGCSDDRACDGGCHWVEPNLCSACAPQPSK